MKNVLITFANRGMGLAYVRHYRNEGWWVRPAKEHRIEAKEMQLESQQEDGE